MLKRILGEINMRVFDFGIKRAERIHRGRHNYTGIDALIAKHRAAGGLANSIQPYKLWSLQQILETHKPHSIIEFGSGLSTVMFSDYAKKTGARVLSIDEDPRWVANTQSMIGADSPVEMKQADRLFEQRTDVKNIHYDFHTDEVFDMALIDGPSAVFDGVKHRDSVNLDVFELRSPPKVILVDIRQPTARYIAERYNDVYDVALSDVFSHGQMWKSEYRYFSVFVRKI